MLYKSVLQFFQKLSIFSVLKTSVIDCVLEVSWMDRIRILRKTLLTVIRLSNFVFIVTACVCTLWGYGVSEERFRWKLYFNFSLECSVMLGWMILTISIYIPVGTLYTIHLSAISDVIDDSFGVWFLALLAKDKL